MATPLHSSAFLSEFSCLGDACEDTCCKGWGMQLTQETVDRYREHAPELLDAVTSGEAEHIMKRDPKTDYCVKFDAGWCGIHRDYGTEFLGDACHFFPRITRRLGDAHLMTASLSCPEVVRLALLKTDMLVHTESQTDRVPHSLKDYLPDAFDADKALEIHRFFITVAAEEGVSAERVLSRLRTVAESMQTVDMASWGMAASFYWQHADSRLPNAEGHPADAFNLLNALQGLIGAARRSYRPRLDETLAEMEKALKVKLNWENLTIQTTAASPHAAEEIARNWNAKHALAMQPVLKRWIQTQLAMALFPFAGFGTTLSERVSILAVRFATLKLALMSAAAVRDTLDEATVVRVVQSLARFLDHLADPTLSVQIYTETGWVREARQRALLDDY